MTKLRVIDVDTAIWMEAVDALSGGGDAMFCDANAPILRSVQSGVAESVGRQLNASLRKHGLIGNTGCISGRGD
eukprot:SAG11_NODE_17506_length_516_cov_1.059952_1_plen_74_part_00